MLVHIPGRLLYNNNDDSAFESVIDVKMYLMLFLN